MPLSVVAFVDHEVGLRLLKRLLALDRRGELSLCGAITTLENGSQWWPGVEGTCRQAGLPLLRWHSPQGPDFSAWPVPDWCLLLSWKHLLPPGLLAWPSRGVVNLHYSLLPLFRGVYPINWAILEGHRSTGVSYHLVDQGIDSGAVLCRQEEPIRSWDTARTLQLRLDDVACTLFETLLARLREDVPPPANGADPRLSHGGYRSRKDYEAKRELRLDRTATVAEVLDHLRGMTFPPGGEILFFRDPQTGRKVFVNLTLRPEEPE